MALTTEWKRRFDRWRRELPNHFYVPLGSLELSGFTTTDQLTPEQAQAGPFRPMPRGTPWGAKWEYGWFKGQVVLPEEAAGQRIALNVDVGGHSLVFIDGKAAGARDYGHAVVTLARSGVPGARYDVLIEAYAGHGPTPEGGGPVAYGREPVPEPGPTQRVVGDTTFGIWVEDAYQLWLDVETLRYLCGCLDSEDLRHIDPDTLRRLLNALDDASLRAAEIEQGLRDFTLIVDFEVPFPEMVASFRAARERLRPLLECVNGSTAPVFYAVGHAHLDVAWLWPLAETERKIARTISNQLALMEEYPDYKYIQPQAHLYRMLSTRYPELYRRFVDAVRRGQIIPEGGMWVEADTNITGGESLIRQFIHGKRFFREEFGVESQMLWLPDVFGYSGALPQILRGCGIRYFTTAKIYWAYNGGDPFPYSTFTWEGIDGSEVLVHLLQGYGNVTHPGMLNLMWRERRQREGIATEMLVFGHGDGGGGATRDHLEFLRRERDLEGCPRVRMASPIEYFQDLEARGVPKARYVGELYFQAHRGTYTSQARTKKNNRKSEFALREAEMWGAAARALAGYSYPHEEMNGAWRTVLLNQFHDILPGSSIHRVYEEAEAMHQTVIASARQTAEAAASAFTTPAAAVTVFNSLSWPRTVLVTLPEGLTHVAGADGEPRPVQVVGGQRLAEVTVPACGWTTLRSAPAAPASVANPLRATTSLLENEFLRLELNAAGEITSIYDKESGRELAAGPCNSFRMYKDVPGWFDAWDLDSMYADTPVELSPEASIEVVCQGPLVATLRVQRRLNRSSLTQEIRLRRGSRRVDFVTTIDWQESHKLLKVAFPVDIHANEAVHEIQFGHIRRPNHYSRPFDADRFEVCNHKWTAIMEEERGCAVLNDCKYGVNVLGNSINLTLLKSALAPDMYADKGEHTFTYAFYAWNGPFATSEVVREAYDLNVPPLTVVGAAGERSLFSVDAPNVIIETVKPAEDGSADVVVRLYEAKRTATRCTLRTALPAAGAAETDMLEEKVLRELSCADGAIALDFRPFEIKTVRLRLGA
ncbi:MAG: alpha-mannosidase [Anaerolineae bacterium]|nr:alpha-mannosidase [Anaerolineae bacterium]